MHSLKIATTVLAAAFLAAVPQLSAQEPNPIPLKFHAIYPQPSQARAQVDQAMQLAVQQHKRVLLAFGNDQSPDCQVLDDLLHEPPNQGQIAEHFLVVHINVGPKLDQNLDLARRFGIPLEKGVPALSVIDGSGQVIHAQTDGEFTHARNMGPADVTEFLNKWRS